MNASKRKHENQINHYDKQKRVLMTILLCVTDAQTKKTYNRGIALEWTVRRLRRVYVWIGEI